MHEQQPSNARLTKDERSIEQRLLQGGSSESYTTLTDYLASKETMFTTAQDMMQGTAGSFLKADNTLRAQVESMSEQFSAAVEIEQGYDAKIEYAAVLFHDVLLDIDRLNIQFSPDANDEIPGHDALRKMFNELLAVDAPNTHASYLQRSVDQLCNKQLDDLLQYSKNSKADLRRIKYNELLDKAKVVAVDAAKIALAGAAFVAVSRFVDRR